MKLGTISFVLISTVLFSLNANSASIMPVGDSITEGLCAFADPSDPSAPQTQRNCYDPYQFGPDAAANSYRLDHGPFDDNFCNQFSRAIVENYNKAAKGGYRGPLINKLLSAPGWIGSVFSGHVQSGVGVPPAGMYHEGHGLWFTAHIDACINQYLTTQSPDVVLLLIGTNDVFLSPTDSRWSGTPSAIANRILSIKNKVLARVPRPRLLIASLSPKYLSNGSPDACAPPENCYEGKRKAINDLVAAGSGMNFPCTARDLPDMGVLTASDLNDGLHPNSIGYAKMADIWFQSLTTPECKFDTRTYVTVGTTLLESITAYGRYWLFGVNQSYFESGTLNRSEIPRYQSICNGKPVCTFDTRTFIPSAGGSVESITAFDKYWNFYPTVQTGTLRSVTRYNSNICSLTASSLPCKFDTRAVTVRSGQTIEAITAYGRYFEFNLTTGALVTSGTLSSVARYTSICQLKLPSETYCTFDTRTFVQLPNLPNLESITAYGKYWNFDASTGALVDSGNLKDVHQRYYP